MGMSTPTTDRMGKLREMLERAPDDPFLWYATGLEHKKLGQTERAIEHFRKALDKDAGYAVAYLQMGQTYEQAGDLESARRAYRDGIAVATAKGDAHAAGEMQGMLDQLG